MSTLTEAAPAQAAAPAAAELTYREAINAALEDEMASDPSVVLLGEDVDADGGVFKTNIGLPDKFPGRVLATPICENGFMGVALGMSITGMRPVVEIMFADFLPTAGDAIVNQLPKYRFMAGGQFSVSFWNAPDARHIGGGEVRNGCGTEIPTNDGCTWARIQQAVDGFLYKGLGDGPVAENTAVEH